MTVFTIAVIIVSGYILWTIFDFLKFKIIERGIKTQISVYFASNLSLFDSIKKAFSNLNKNRQLGLKDFTIEQVRAKIADLVKIMNIDNVIEVYSTFVHRYVFSNVIKIKLIHLEDAFKNLNFNWLRDLSAKNELVWFHDNEPIDNLNLFFYLNRKYFLSLKQIKFEVVKNII